MAEIRRLLSPKQKKLEREGLLPEDAKPTGKWQATVRQLGGTKRWSHSDHLKRVVEVWADDQEAAMRRGDFIDPNAGKLTLGDWWEKWTKTRRVEIATMDKNRSWWRNHIEPKFGTRQLSAIQSWDVEEWVTELSGRVGAETVASSLRLLTQMLAAAAKHRLIGTNPAALVSAPTPPKHVDRFLTRAESEMLLEQFTGEDRVFVEMLLYCGLRFQEAAGLRRFRVDLLRKRIQIAKVQPRKGTEKKPKTDAGVRPVPLTDELAIQLSRLIPAPDDGLVFTSPTGERIRYDNWLRRIWQPALQRASLADPQPTPHDLRHTYGSWLGEAGVPPAQIAALMGHAGLRSVERYIHATEARFDQARSALEGPGNTTTAARRRP